MKKRNKRQHTEVNGHYQVPRYITHSKSFRALGLAAKALYYELLDLRNIHKLGNPQPGLEFYTTDAFLIDALNMDRLTVRRARRELCGCDFVCVQLGQRGGRATVYWIADDEGVEALDKKTKRELDRLLPF